MNKVITILFCALSTVGLYAQHNYTDYQLEIIKNIPNDNIKVGVGVFVRNFVKQINSIVLGNSCLSYISFEHYTRKGYTFIFSIHILCIFLYSCEQSFIYLRVFETLNQETELFCSLFEERIFDDLKIFVFVFDMIF